MRADVPGRAAGDTDRNKFRCTAPAQNSGPLRAVETHLAPFSTVCDSTEVCSVGSLCLQLLLARLFQ